MKVGMLAFGTQGDVQPYLALGAALVRAGHDVKLVTHHGYAITGRELGIDVTEVQGNVQEAMQSPELRELLRRGNFLKINAYTSRLIQEYSVGWLRTALAALHDRDLLACGIGGLHQARALSEHLRIPVIEAHVVPFTPTREFPAPLVPAWLGRLGGGVSHPPCLPAGDVAGLPPGRRRGPTRRPESSPCPIDGLHRLERAHHPPGAVRHQPPRAAPPG
jgi:UDP:flavonoid glycosyltransferase YjiC (YdhE family)